MATLRPALPAPHGVNRKRARFVDSQRTVGRGLFFRGLRLFAIDQLWANWSPGTSAARGCSPAVLNLKRRPPGPAGLASAARRVLVSLSEEIRAKQDLQKRIRADERRRIDDASRRGADAERLRLAQELQREQEAKLAAAREQAHAAEQAKAAEEARIAQLEAEREALQAAPQQASFVAPSGTRPTSATRAIGDRPLPRLDVGLGGGWNNPAGLLGGYRVTYGSERINPLLQATLNLSEPGGPLVGLAFGYSFL